MIFLNGPSVLFSFFVKIDKQMRAPHTWHQNREKPQNLNSVQAHDGQCQGMGGRIEILMASASRYPNFNLETVDLEVLSGIRKHQNRERALLALQTLLFASEWEDRVVIYH